MPTYAITADATEVNEGSSVTFTVAVTESEIETYYWTIAGTNVVNSDFSDTTIQGTVSIIGSAGVASVIIPLAADVTLEGYEYFILQLRTDAYDGEIVAISPVVTIVDTSDGVPPLTLENGRIGTLSTDSGQLLYAFNDVVYKVTGTPISF
jgi:hypothetical protein